MTEATTLVDYDPFAPESMVDPRPVYETLRAAGPVHYLPKYNAWAMASFEALWQVCRKPRSFTTEHRGMPPISSLLGEPSIVNFTATNSAEHAAMRRVLNPRYNRNAADLDAEAMRTLAREVLTPLVAGGSGEMDVFKEYAARVAARYAAEKVGLPAEDAERIRRRAEEFFVREPGQVGTSPTNGEAAGEVFQYLQELVAAARQDPSKARGDLAVLLETEIDGAKFDDLRIAGDLFTLLITGSETTETGVAATLYYLAQHPDQLAQLRADHSLIAKALMETIRYDHPTDILCREVAEPVEICGQMLEPGQQVVMLWGSASRDEDEFPDAASFNIHRTYRRHLLFGHGQHKCLGESVALRLGTIMLEEFFEAVDHYEVDEAACQRKYAEFVQGFNSVPIRFEVATRVSA